MADSREVPEIENKKNSKNKNLFKRFKINLEDFGIEKSDFDEKSHDNKYSKDNIHNLDMGNKDLVDQEETINRFNNENGFILDGHEEMMNELKDEDDFIFKDNPDNNGNIDFELLNGDFDQELLHSEENEILPFEENETVNENLPLSSEIKEIISKDSKREFPVLSILGLAIGIFLITTGILIFLGNSDKIVDNVISGETGALSVLITFIGVVFITLTLLDIFSQKKVFGSVFHIIKDFESEINEDNDEME